VNKKCIDDYGERVNTGAIKRVEDAEAAVQQEQDDTRNAENARLTNREPETTFQEMIVAIADIQCDPRSTINGEDVEDDDNEETEQGQLSMDGGPGCVMDTITKMVHQLRER